MKDTIRNALTRRPQRTFILPACGAVLGLIAAGSALLRVAPQVETVPPGYIALVNRKGILTSDYQAQTAALAGKPFSETTHAERSKTLHDMIDEELLVQRGMVLDLPETTTEVRDVITAAVNAQVDAAIKGQPPTDAELKSFYDSHRSRYSSIGTMSLRDLVLHVGGYQNADQSTAQAETDAAEAVYQLRSGVAVERVMQHFGFVDSGRADKGEVLDSAAKLHLGLKLFQVAATLSDGEISEAVAETDGVHVLLMEHRKPPRVADFDSVRPKVYGDYLEAAAKGAEAENLKILRKDAQILLAPDLVQVPVP
jgi:parvulin-like peptidyl-prolyl isomerase